MRLGPQGLRFFSYLFPVATCFLGVLSLTVQPGSLGAAETGPAGGAAPVYVGTYEGVINPVAAEYINHVLAEASEGGAGAVVLRLDTPGGLDTSMRLIIKDITASPVPVIVYVAPGGGRAASAGVFILLAAHFAAMAPGTNVGAAHPVAMGGGEMDAVMKAKVENDAAAYIKSIAEKRGRNVKWAEDAVRKSVSVTEKEALSLKIIDLIADDVPSLLAAVDGREVVTGAGKVVLRTKGAVMRELPMGWRLEALKALSDPNIAFILMTLGTIGLLAELYNPGAILPGIVGAISLILAFYSLQTLPINYAGVLLIILGVVLFILEIKVVSYGLLSLGGIASMVLGALMLVKTDVPFLKVSLSVIIPTVVTFGGLLLAVTWLAVQSQWRRPVTGVESMVGTIAHAKTDLAPRGKVFVQGEIWDAVSDEPIREGEEAEVKAIQGLTLTVRPHRK
jgi:membrane-bound serine protease (ClpP class)